MIAHAKCQICGCPHSIIEACPSTGPDDSYESRSSFDAVMSAGGVEPSKITQALVSQLYERDAHGREKYGVTLERDDLSLSDWLQHMAEELMDGAGYALAAKRENNAMLHVIVDKAMEALGELPPDEAFGAHKLLTQIRSMIGSKPQPPITLTIDKHSNAISEAIRKVLYNNWTDPNCEPAQKAWIELGVHRLVCELRAVLVPKP